MNIFENYLSKINKIILDNKKLLKLKFLETLDNVSLEVPPSHFNYDLSSNISLVLAKANKMNPIYLANHIKNLLLQQVSHFEKIDIAGPGFLNIKLSKEGLIDNISDILKNKSVYGSKKSNKKYNIEFVSANPTGPLHVGHCRGAILGDALSNILSFNGNKITKEYYVNDYGSQIRNFVLSVYCRILEISKKKPFPSNKDLYPGDYIVDIAKKIIKKKSIKNFSSFEKIYKKLSIESLKYSMQMINENLKLLGIKHDSFIYESKLINNNEVSKVIKKLKKKNYIYEGKLETPKGEQSKDWKIRNQLLFKSTMFGDDTDRPLQKADGSWTYFAGDLAYHSNKISRKFDILINILGADHAGYTKRITSGTKAISDNKVDLICKVSQLVKLFKDGKPFKMSKRKGDYITVNDLIKEVGKDSVRFMMLSRSNDVELDFDFKNVTEKSKENPVFYVQYAFARINSIFKLLKLDLNKKIKINNNEFTLNEHEIQIMKKISEWPRCMEICSNKLEPHRISFYLYELVTLFHAYWNMGKVNKEFRFVPENSNLNNSRLILLQALSIVIKNGMSILGVSTPRSM